jgi:hypothetical protein
MCWYRSKRWRSWLRHWATSRKVAGSIIDGVIDIILPHYGLGFDTASNRNEYRDYFVGVKGSRCIRLATSMCRLSEIWEPQPFGTLRACTGIVLPLFAGTCEHIKLNLYHQPCKLISSAITYARNTHIISIL